MTMGKEKRENFALFLGTFIYISYLCSTKSIKEIACEKRSKAQNSSPVMVVPNRNPVVSMAKGMAIILVVVGHSLPLENWARNYIYMFHVPLFFYVSGYCFKEKYLNDALTFVKRRLRGLWWPFVKYGIPMVLLHNVLCAIHVYGPLCDVVPYTLPQMGVAVLKQFAMSGAEPLLGAYWFLNTLFGASLLFYGCRRLAGSKWAVAILLTGSVACLLLVPYTGGLRIVFRMFLAGTYMALGHLFAGMESQEDRFMILTRIKRPIPVILLAALVAVGEWMLPHEMTDATLPTLLPCILTALAGIWMLWGVCQWLLAAGSRLMVRLSHVLDFIGNHTLTILTWHFLCFKVVTLLIILLYGLPMDQLEVLPIIEEQAAQGWWMVYALAGVCVVFLKKQKQER